MRANVLLLVPLARSCTVAVPCPQLLPVMHAGMRTAKVVALSSNSRQSHSILKKVTVSRTWELPSGKKWHCFISYFNDESEAVFDGLRSFLRGKGLVVFNQKRDLAGVEVNAEQMESEAR